MDRFFNSRENDANAIINREEALLPDYVPSEAVHRTNEMKEIAEAINPMCYGKKCNNLFIFGPSGTGKTTCMKLLIEQLGENTSKVIPVYVNCWEYTTKMAVYYKICEALKIILPRRGLASDEVFERILEVMRNDKHGVLIVLDELDSLIFNGEQSLLYSVSRVGDSKVNFGIIGISNKKDSTKLIDSRASSSLRFTTVEFKEYGEDQLLEILTERVKVALVPGTYDKNVLQECSKIGAENNGSARLALEVLWKAAKRADKKDSKKIALEDVYEVTKTLDKRPSTKRTYTSISFDELDLKLTKEEKTIIAILAEGEKSSSELYEEFSAKESKSKRQIRNYLMTLEAKGLIESKEVDYRANSFLKTKVYFLKKRGVD